MTTKLSQLMSENLTENNYFITMRDLYSVSSKVSAKNAFGVEDEIMFKLIYQVDASTTTLMYFELDGTTVVNNMSSIDVPERKKIEDPGANT
jgi:stage III sporulation protein SpoIIIAA